MIKLGIFAPASGLFSCPLAMTDGAARTIEAVGQVDALEEAYANLTSRDPHRFWTSGQWMTEKAGGSDVSQATETVALPTDQKDVYKLHGYKWFSSATDSDMTLLLAHVLDEEGEKKGLSMFYGKTRKDNGTLNGIEVVKLKNKLGTRQLPTGELQLVVSN